MAKDNSSRQTDRQIIADAKSKGSLATFGAYIKLSGPGWLQSAITLGGGSLGSSLYLGVLAGFALLWLQPIAMIIGIIMLSAISYVTLSTGERPFKAIRTHVNPVLGWGWLLATLLANCVWSLPQFNLAWGAMTQNLMPETFDKIDPFTAKAWIAGSIAVLCIIVVFLYDLGGWGLKLFNILLKLMVAVIVISFFGVVIYMSKEGALNWGAIGGGLIPDLSMLWTPAETFSGILAQAGEEYGKFWSAKIVSEQQDVLIAAAATAVGINMTFLLPYSMLKRGWDKQFRGLAVFDLSTGLFIPFILATGCVVIASAAQFHHKPCVPFSAEEAAIAITNKTSDAGFADMSDEQKTAEIQAILADAYKDNLKEEVTETFPKAAATAVLPTVTGDRFLGLAQRVDKIDTLTPILAKADKDSVLPVDKKLEGGYKKLAALRVKKEMGADYDRQFGKDSSLSKDEQTALLDARIAQLPLPDRKLAAMLVRRDSIHLARALSPLTGDVVAHYVFGIGVVGMAISSIIILMLINGFTICEMVDRPSRGWLYRFGCMIPAVGVLGPFIWSGAAPFLAIPTSVIGFIVIPIAYTTFALLLNQKKLLGDNMPKGLLRLVWNLLMFVGVIAVMIGSTYMAWKKTKGLPGIWGGGWVGLAGIGLFILLVLIAHFVRRADRKPIA